MKLSLQLVWLLTVFFCLFLCSLQTLASTSSCSGEKTLLVAVIDTGIDSEHPELKNWIWTNPGESGLDSLGRDKSSNGFDDDGNGFADDLHGWNFVKNSSEIQDQHGHGTHVSGLITKYWPSSYQKELCPPIQLMILKYFDQSFPLNDTLSSSVRAFKYALDQGARIINFSGGGSKKSKTEEEIIRRALKQNVLIVAAAGNEGASTDKFPFYPASYNQPHILSVAALNQHHQLLSNSNYGPQIRLAMTGENLKSTLPQKKFGLMSGTSQATALTAGIAALILKHKPWLTEPRQLIEQLTKTSDQGLPQLMMVKGIGRLNILRSLRSQDRFISASGRSVKNANFIPEKTFLDAQFVKFNLNSPQGI